MNKEPDGELAAEQDRGREDQNKVKSAYHSFHTLPRVTFGQASAGIPGGVLRRPDG